MKAPPILVDEVTSPSSGGRLQRDRARLRGDGLAHEDGTARCVPKRQRTRTEVRSTSCSQVTPSWAISIRPAIVCPSALKGARKALGKIQRRDVHGVATELP